ncbi:MAG: hypothetical protein EOP51_18770, partial [Sphingobacteriales bacterium]
ARRVHGAAITGQPTSATVNAPIAASFTVTASGSSTYQWQIFDGVNWVNVPATAPYSGTTTATLNITPTDISLSDNEYRCIVQAATPCTDVISNVVSLTVNPTPCGVTESFANIPTTSSGTYLNRMWTGDNGFTWNATSARTDQTLIGKAIATDAVGTVTSPTVSGGIGTLSFKYVRAFTGTGGRTIKVYINGNQFGADIVVNPGSNTVQNYSSLINISGPVTVELRTSGAQIIIDDINWTCYTGCTPLQTIAGFTPSEGPAGTLVTINGTSFTAGSSVKFGGILSTAVTFVNSTTLIAEVPSGAISGPITVTESGCDRISAGTFTLLSSNNNCGVAGVPVSNGLIITEVFDSEVGTLGYVELFNPTTSAISLSSYSIRVATGANNDYSLGSGSLASGATMVVRLGNPTSSNSTVCTVPTPVTQDAAGGFNGNDQIILRLGTANHDVVNNPNYGSPNNDNYRGFSQLRNPGNTTPRATYVPAEWTNSNTESCSHLGIAPTAISSNNITVSSHPADVSCNQPLTFSVTAVATPSLGTYVWRYQAPGSAIWELVSNFPAALGVSVTAAGQPSITITGNTANLKDYQFYVEVSTAGSPSCSRYSNAAQYSYDSKAVYRPKTGVTTGNWSDYTIWEMSDLASGTFINACTYPTALNSSEVIISAGKSITLDIDNPIDKLTIDVDATLTSTATSTLDILNGGTGADFILNGTFIDGANNSNGIGFDGTSSWVMGNAATLIKTNTSGSAAYRDNYDGGISNIPATAKWILRGNSAMNVSFTTASGSTGSYPSASYYPNLIFESTSGVWNPLLATSRFTGSLSTATIKGDLDIGGTGAGTVVVYNENIFATPIKVNGNLLVRAGNTLTNAGDAAGTGFEVSKNITVDGILNINANNKGLLKLSGIADQIISGNGAENMNIDSLVIDKLPAGKVINNRKLNVYNTFAPLNASIWEFGTGDLVLKSNLTKTARVEVLTAATITYPAAGRFVVERYIHYTGNWNLLASPTTELTPANAQSIYNSWQEAGVYSNTGYGTQVTMPAPIGTGLDNQSPGYSFKWWNNATRAFVGVSNTTTELVNRPQGFFGFVRGDRTYTSGQLGGPTTLRSRGRIYTPTTPAPATTVLLPTSINGYFISVANPLASTIDFDKVLVHSTGIKDAYSVWDPTPSGNYGVGRYNTFNKLLGQWINQLPAGLYVDPDSTLQSGQAFYVEADNLVASIISFEEADKLKSSRTVTRIPIVMMSTMLHTENGAIADGNRAGALYRFVSLCRQCRVADLVRSSQGHATATVRWHALMA